MSDVAAQDFWLAQLSSAGHFNDWVFARFANHLGGDVLEIGCGSGNFTTLIAARARHVTAVDIHQPYVEAAQRRVARHPHVRVFCADATAVQWAETFDTVILLDVLEHIADDAGFLLSLRRCLKPGGRLILKVPAGRWLYSPMDKAIGHYRRYDRRTLAAVLRAAGLVPVDQSYFNLFGILGWWLNGRVLKRITPPAGQLGLFERLVPLFRLVEDALRLPLGLSLIAVGSAPSTATDGTADP